MTQHLRGIALLLSAQFFLAAMDALAKQLSQTFSAPMLVWGRYTVHCLLMVVLLAPSYGRQLIQTQRLLVQTLRALLLLATSTLGILALRMMPLAETAGLAFISPILATLLARVWLQEKIRIVGWVAIFCGAVGAMLIARPGGQLPVAGVLLVISSALTFSVYQILTRQLSQSESAISMLFLTALAGAICMNLALPWIWDGKMPDTLQAAQIIGLGIFGGTGHYLIIHAFRHAPVSALTPFMHVQLVWATLLGWQLFGQLPDRWSVLGMAIIVCSGLILSFRR